MLAIGVGGADAVDAMTGTPWELKAPQIVGEFHSQHGPAVMLNFVLARCTLNWEIEWMGHTERFDPASCRKADSSSEQQYLETILGC